MCLRVDEVEGAVRGQVLILKRGCLSWSRPTVTAAPLVICLGHGRQVELTQRLPGGPGALWGSSLAQDVQSTRDSEWRHAFSCTDTGLCLSLCPFAPQKNRRRAALLPGKKTSHAPSTVSASPSAVRE